MVLDKKEVVDKKNIIQHQISKFIGISTPVQLSKFTGISTPKLLV
jgi:hypothetical protein